MALFQHLPEIRPDIWMAAGTAQFNTPTGDAIDVEGNIYVADVLN